MALGDAIVRTGRKLQSATKAIAVEHRDRRLAQSGHRIECDMAFAHPEPAKVLRRLTRPGTDVAAGTEGFFARAGDECDTREGMLDLTADGGKFRHHFPV